MVRPKIFGIVALLELMLCLQTFSQQNNSVHYRVQGLADGKAYLLSVHGKKYEAVDSVDTKNGEITFILNDKMPVGMYRISFDKDLFTDVIINKENVDIENNVNDLYKYLKVIASRENTVYYSYWKASRNINDTINLIAAMGDKIYEANGHVLTHDLDSMQRKAGQLNRKLNIITDSLIAASNGLLVQKILLAYRTPDFETYRRQPGAKPYKKRGDFLKEHYFDNIDFTDSRLLNTEVFHVACTEYIGMFADPASDSIYTSVSDFILSKAIVNPDVYAYFIQLLINTFEDSPWEQTFVHLVNVAVQENSCNAGTGLKTEKQKAAAIIRLKTGNVAPQIIMNDASGKPEDLFAVKAKITLLMFWSPDCEHCAEAMPHIREIYAQYKPMGFEIFAVSVGSDKNAWQKTVIEKKMVWINVSDLKGPDSDALINYNAWTTPTFILLDENHKIMARPINVAQVKEFLKEKF
ncbi:MAG: redoxin domain-containing protein [Bacteroidota bacterium]